MLLISPKNPPNIPNLFCCENCNYNTSNKKDFNKHNTTPKHFRLINATIDEFKNPQSYLCSCGNNYKHISSLYKHKKSCLYLDSNNNNTENDTSNCQKEDVSILSSLVFEVVKQNKELIIQNNENQKKNQELTQQLFEICKTVSINSNNNNMINSNNKSFNLNFFLNETCKDAMNMSEFIESMKIQLSDLENVGKLGFVDGISNIIIKNLEALDVEKRPIHCCDSKRETMYIKDQDKWEKDDNEFKRMKELVRYVRDKNISLVNTWRDLYPECVRSDSKKTTQFNQIYMESFGGEKGTKKEKEEKIISRIAKSVVIDKHE
jgi:hypothetical protein